MSQEDIDAQEIIIKTPDKEYVFHNAQVQKVSMQGQTSFQITGEPEIRERALELKIVDEDIDTVSEQAGVSKEEARKALEGAQGDIAQAIVDLSQ